MAGNIKLGLVIGGAVSSSVGKAFSDVEGRIRSLDGKAGRTRALQGMIGDTIKLREEWRKAHAQGAAGASTLLTRLNANLDALKAQGVQVGKLGRAYEQMGRQARAAELKDKGRAQVGKGVETVKSAAGNAVVAAGAMAAPTMVSANYNAIIRDIAIKAGIANKPQEAAMSQTIIQTSRDSGMARNDVADLVNQLVGAGMDVTKALEYAPVAAKFAIGQGSAGTDTAKMINALGQNAKITDAKEMQQALEAIAYQGQAGSFEAADMAKWFPELLAMMASQGIHGMDAVTQLGAILQVQMKNAGSSDEAANNLKNWIGKIGARDTVEAYKKVGIDYEGSMQTGLQKGMSTLESSFSLAQKYIEKTDPKKAKEMAEATAKISKEADPAKAQAMLTALNESLKTGDIFADMQVKAALQAYLQNKQLYNDLKSQSRNSSGILDKNLAERRDTSAQKWTELAQASDDALRSVGDAIRPLTDAAAEGLTTVAKGIGSLVEEFPGWASGLTVVVGGLIAAKGALGAFTIGKGLLNLAKGGLTGLRGGKDGKPEGVQEVFVTNAGAVGLAAGKAGGGKGQDKKSGLLDVGLTVAKKALGGGDDDKPDAAAGEGGEDGKADGDGKDDKPKGAAGLALAALEAFQEAREGGDDDDKEGGDSGGDGLQRVFVVNASEIGATVEPAPGPRRSRRNRRNRRGRDQSGQASPPRPGAGRQGQDDRNRPPGQNDRQPNRNQPPRPVPDADRRPRPGDTRPGQGDRPRPDLTADTAARRLAPPVPIPDAPDLPASGLRALAGRAAHAIPGEALVSAGMQAFELYQSDAPQEEKLQAAAGLAGGGMGGWAGASAGAAIGTLVLPGIGTAVGAAIGGVVGQWGGSELGDMLGKYLFGGDDEKPEPVKPPEPVSLLAQPAQPPAGTESVLNAAASAIGATQAGRGPVITERPAPLAPLPSQLPPSPVPPGPAPGDVARALIQPAAVPPAAPTPQVLVPKPEPVKVLEPKYEQQVQISAPLTLTVHGDVKDPQQLMQQLEPMIQRVMRDATQQAQRASLFDAPHVEQ